ncbi:MAG: BatA domain-containing protein [Planctomycetota bacterium]|jgi:hypothetical protein
MSIAFLYPLAWLGAAAVAAPIWLHLRRRKDASLVRFSAIRFLDDQPAARRRPLWPHQWPLLLLRIAGLLLLLAAFSWPYVATLEDAPIRESRVYVLDNTLSHRAGGEFDGARDEILEALADSSLETQIAVIELTAQPRVVVGFGDDPYGAAAKIRDLKPSFQRGSYLAAFRAANRLLSRSLGESRHIVLLGDSQENQWTEGENAVPFLDDVDVTLPEVAATSAANLALAEPIVKRVFVGDRAVAECTVRLYHQGEFDSATLVVQSNGEEVLRREIPLAGEPAALTCLAQWEVDPAEWIRGEARLEGVADALDADDRVVFSLRPIREGRVGLVARSTYLRTALSPEVMRGRWSVGTRTAPDFAAPSESDLPDDVLCVESRYLESSSARRLVLDALEQGRGVVLVVDQVTPVITGFLAELGVETLPDSEAPPEPAGFRYVALEHEIFRPFRSADFGDLTEIVVSRYRRLKSPGAVPLIFSASGDPLLLELEKGKGKLLVLAFSLDRTETSWPLHPTFIPFLDRCLRRTRSEPALPTSFLPGEACVWSVPPGRAAAEVVVRAIGATEGVEAGEALRAKVENDQARFSVPREPGLYTLSYDDRAEPESLLSVNPPPEESYLSYTESPRAVEAWKRESGQQEASHESAGLALELSTWEILRQRVWWWLLLGGLAALMTETLWASKRGLVTK